MRHNSNFLTRFSRLIFKYKLIILSTDLQTSYTKSHVNVASSFSKIRPGCLDYAEDEQPLCKDVTQTLDVMEKKREGMCDDPQWAQNVSKTFSKMSLRRLRRLKRHL